MKLYILVTTVPGYGGYELSNGAIHGPVAHEWKIGTANEEKKNVIDPPLLSHNYPADLKDIQDFDSTAYDKIVAEIEDVVSDYYTHSGELTLIRANKDRVLKVLKAIENTRVLIAKSRTSAAAASASGMFGSPAHAAGGGGGGSGGSGAAAAPAPAPAHSSSGGR